MKALHVPDLGIEILDMHRRVALAPGAWLDRLAAAGRHGGGGMTQ
jgi:hypothetical protein